VEAQLWGEIRKTLAASPRINYPPTNLASFKLSEDRWAMGFSTSPEHAGVNLQGFHGARVLVIIDEATGVDGPIWGAIEGARAGGAVRQLVLCNPVVPSVRSTKSLPGSARNGIRLLSTHSTRPTSSAPASSGMVISQSRRCTRCRPA
jgi:hypothetical protein